MQRRLFLIAFAFAGCSGTQLRQVPCNLTQSCDGGDVWFVGDLDSGLEESIDSGETADASDVSDAGVAIDAGDAGVMEADAGAEDAGVVAIPDAGQQPNVDLLCHDPDAGVVFPPITELPNTVPADCLVGFELNNYHSIYSIDALSTAGSRALTLEVDIATYQQPDVIRMEGVLDGVAQDLLLTCRLQTWDSGDPTRGLTRPPDASIRSFRVPLTGGTTRLTFDFTGASTPTYIRVLGLCDFDLQPPSPTNLRWRRVTSR